MIGADGPDRLRHRERLREREVETSEDYKALIEETKTTPPVRYQVLQDDSGTR